MEGKSDTQAPATSTSTAAMSKSSPFSPFAASGASSTPIEADRKSPNGPLPDFEKPVTGESCACVCA